MLENKVFTLVAMVGRDTSSSTFCCMHSDAVDRCWCRILHVCFPMQYIFGFTDIRNAASATERIFTRGTWTNSHMFRTNLQIIIKTILRRAATYFYRKIPLKCDVRLMSRCRVSILVFQKQSCRFSKLRTSMHILTLPLSLFPDTKVETEIHWGRPLAHSSSAFMWKNSYTNMICVLKCLVAFTGMLGYW